MVRAVVGRPRSVKAHIRDVRSAEARNTKTSQWSVLVRAHVRRSGRARIAINVRK